MYVYTRNNPTNFGDPTGLYRLIGFSPADAQKMRDAINSAIKKLGETCDGCGGPDGPKIAKALQGATFVYVKKSEKPRRYSRRMWERATDQFKDNSCGLARLRPGMLPFGLVACSRSYT